MENQHLSYFKVKNFKKFDSLEVEDIGQFNLIVGDNNVGKTCLLEALILEFHAKKTLSSLHYIFEKRNIKIDENIKYSTGKEDFNFDYNLIGLSQKNKSEPLILFREYFDESSETFQIENLKNYNPIDKEDTDTFIDSVNLFQYKGIDQISKNWLIFKYGKSDFSHNNLNLSDENLQIKFLCDVTSEYYKNFYTYLDYFNLIRLADYNQITFFYKEVIKNPNDEEKLIKILNNIFPNINIQRFSILDFFNNKEYLHISSVNKVDYHPINEYGDGFTRILSILLETLYNKNKSINIDEIEIGIHYSKLREFWINLLQLCKELKVQLFATTHSEECAEAFAQAATKLKLEKECRLITLKENKNENDIVAYTKSIDELETAIENDFNFRG
jgi:AAA15 family ATPase/GTPase